MEHISDEMADAATDYRDDRAPATKGEPTTTSELEDEVTAEAFNLFYRERLADRELTWQELLQCIKDPQRRKLMEPLADFYKKLKEECEREWNFHGL